MLSYFFYRVRVKRFEYLRVLVMIDMALFLCKKKFFCLMIVQEMIAGSAKNVNLGRNSTLWAMIFRYLVIELKYRKI